MANDIDIYVKLDQYTAGFLTSAMEVRLEEYTRQAPRERHPEDKAEAYRVVAQAATVLAAIHSARVYVQAEQILDRIDPEFEVLR